MKNRLIPLLALLSFFSQASVDITTIEHVIDKEYVGYTGEMVTYIEDKTTPILLLGSDETRETVFLLSQTASNQIQGFVLSCHPTLKQFPEQSQLMININGGAERTTFDDKPNASVWHGKLTNNGCALAKVGLSEALYRVIDDTVINVETWIFDSKGEKSIISNAYYIGNSTSNEHYDLPFKVFMNNVHQTLNHFNL